MSAEFPQNDLIEITPEMIIRGRYYLAALDPDYFGYCSDSLVETVLRVPLGFPVLDEDQARVVSEGERLRLAFESVRSHARQPAHAI
jgi:hypothetical protein